MSADKHIFVADSGKLQKFSFSSYEASANVCGTGYGVAIHPSGKIFTLVDDQTIQVFNDNLSCLLF